MQSSSQILWGTFDNSSGILELFFNENHQIKKKKKSRFMDAYIFAY